MPCSGLSSKCKTVMVIDLTTIRSVSIGRLVDDDCLPAHTVIPPVELAVGKGHKGCAIAHMMACASSGGRLPIFIRENDATPLGEPSRTIVVPDCADAVWLGYSSFGGCLNLRRDETCYAMGQDIVRVLGTLATHALVIISRRYLFRYMEACLIAATTESPVDLILANEMRQYFVYGPRVPYYYQGPSGQNHAEEWTRITPEIQDEIR